jgi:hypothetical protein
VDENGEAVIVSAGNMKAHEIFEKISPATAAEIFVFLQKEEKPVFKAAIQGLANQRNLRPVFIERKPPEERYLWVQAALSRKIGDGVATHLLHTWLLGAQKEMLCDFLDALEIPHDENGMVEDVPESPSKEKIAGAVSVLLAKYPAEFVAIYLRVFQAMDSAADWQPLDEILNEEPRLQFVTR